MTKPQTRDTPLETFRLDRGWSYRRLAAAISVLTGITVSEPTITRFCQRRGRPHRTTTHAVQKFLAAQRQEASR